MSFWKNKNKPAIPEPPQYGASYDDRDRDRGPNKYYEQPGPGDLYPPQGQQPARGSSPYRPQYEDDEYSQPARDDYGQGGYSNPNQNQYRPSNTLQKKPAPRDQRDIAREANTVRSMPDRTANRSAGTGESFARHGEDINAARNALFAGATVKPGGSGRYDADQSGGGGGGGGGEEDEDDLEVIQKKTKDIKQSSVQKTREALIALQQTEEQGRNVLNKLGAQSEQLGMTERHLQVSKGYIRRADDNTTDIKTLNRSIFIPAITFDKSKKRAAQEAKLSQRYEEERVERESTQDNIRDTQERIANATRGPNRDGPPRFEDDEEDEESLGGGGRRPGASRGAGYQAKKQQWAKYQTQDDDSEDDALEEELSNNLDQMSLGIARIKAQALAQGEEVTRQNVQLKKLHSSVDDVDQRLVNSTDRMRRL